MQGYIMTLLLIWNVTIFGGKRDGKFQAFLLDYFLLDSAVVCQDDLFDMDLLQETRCLFLGSVTTDYYLLFF